MLKPTSANLAAQAYVCKRLESGRLAASFSDSRSVTRERPRIKHSVLLRLSAGKNDEGRQCALRSQSFDAPFDRSMQPPAACQLSSGGVALTEFIDASASVNHLLLAGIERMAIGAHLKIQVVAGRASLELIAAAANYVDLFVLRMNASFHCRRR